VLFRSPLWRILAIGVGAITFKRVAQVEIPGLHRTVWVDLSDIQPLSKNKRRKLARYHRGALPKELVEQVEQKVAQAVARLLG
jgi:predicted RNA-binding protein YlxR (DUF448 family)